MLAAYGTEQNIPYPLLSDVDSAVIKRFGILNDTVQPGDAMLYGIPYPGSYVCDGDGVVIAKFFHDTYKKRDSPELLLDAALGRVQLDPDLPGDRRADPEVAVTATVHGGRGTLRQGIVRHLVLRFELADSLHVYGAPAPDGMVPLTIELSGPPGLVFEDVRLPPTKPLLLEGMNLTLQVWSGTFDASVPFYATGELASETRPLETPAAAIDIQVRFQACDDNTCLLPRTESFELTLPLDVVDVPNLGVHTGHGQREGTFDASPHFRRLLRRKILRHPLGFLRFLVKNRRLLRDAQARQTATHPGETPP